MALNQNSPRGEKALAAALRQLLAQAQGLSIVRYRFGSRRSARHHCRKAQTQANAKLHFVALPRLRHRRHHAQCAGIVRDRFLHGEAAQVALAGVAPIGDGPLALAGQFELLRQHFRCRVDDVRKTLLQDQGDGRVQALTPRPQHGGIGAVLDQCVLEDIGRVRRRTAHEDELGLGQSAKASSRTASGRPADRGHELIREFASNGCADLQHFARRTEAVDARHKRRLQRGRNGERPRRLVKHILVAGFLQLLAFEHGLGEFFDEQRHAVGAVDDLIEQVGRQRLATGDVGRRAWRARAATAG